MGSRLLTRRTLRYHGDQDGLNWGSVSGLPLQSLSKTAGQTMTALGPLLTRLAVFACGCLLCVVWLDVADAGQARQPRQPPPPSKCGCDDKQAMQRDSDDSNWLANAHRQKADVLQRSEDALYRRMGRSIADGSDEMTALWSSYNAWEQGTGPGTARAEFETARKYQGSIVVTFDQKTESSRSRATRDGAQESGMSADCRRHQLPRTEAYRCADRRRGPVFTTQSACA